MAKEAKYSEAPEKIVSLSVSGFPLKSLSFSVLCTHCGGGIYTKSKYSAKYAVKAAIIEFLKLKIKHCYSVFVHIKRLLNVSVLSTKFYSSVH